MSVIERDLAAPVLIKPVAGQVCPLCGESGDHTDADIHIRRCANGHGPVLLSWAWPSVEAYEAQYSSETAEYHDATMRQSGRDPFVKRDAEYLRTAAARLRMLREQYPDAESVLDIGAGNGCVVAQSAAYGFAGRGIEPCPVMAAFAKKLGRQVQCGTWRDACGKWDIVTLYDVFEHLSDPNAALEHLVSLLNETGCLVIEMPEYLAPGNWERHVKPSEHPVLYSDSAAREMFARAELRWDLIYRPRGGELGKIVYFLRRV